MITPIRVVVADDQEIIRAGLSMLIDAEPDMEVVGQAADGQQAIDFAYRLKPDVCLFDIRMPVVDGLEATRRLAGPEVTNPIPIVVITTFDLDEYVHAALQAGARGFLLKDAGPQILAQAIRSAADGDALIAPNVLIRLLKTFAGGAKPRRPEPVDPLTDREEDVLAAVASGLTNAEVGERLHISVSTVKTHVASLILKLGVRNRVELCMWAYETRRMH